MLNLIEIGQNMIYKIPLGPLVCDVFLCFVTFPCSVMGQVWY